MSIFRFFALIWTVLSIMTALLNAQSEFKYSYIPKKVYSNQVFPVTVMAVSEDGSPTPKFTFATDSKVQPLFKDPLIVKNGMDGFYTFYFKAQNSDIRIPALMIISQSHQDTLDAKVIPLETLPKREDFSNVLAADMKIKNNQVSNYDENHYLLTLSIEAYEANLEDMQLKKVVEDGIEDLKRTQAKVETGYYAVIPITQKVLTFTYFNTIKQQFILFKIPVEITDSSVTTQSDLNPQEDSFEQLKKYVLIFFVIFFLLMFIIKRDFFYLVFGVVALITLLTFYIPHKKVCIKQGASLYILPTQTSTMSTKVDHEFEAILLGERGEFKKVEYQKGIIGWIKNEDLCEN
ncbi:MAG: hypothetical protein IE885_06885 [Campylobacterales bacterium]|nr:hypothetical protein [Campylobacterales bacterium]